MSVSYRRAAALLAVGVFLGIALAPAALADHAYSHRFVVIGRVLDDQGRPIQGAEVEVGLPASFNPEGFCDPRNTADSSTGAWQRTLTQTRTNEYGEFIYCFHYHNMPRITSENVRIKVLGHEAEAPIDTQFRRVFTTVTVPGGEGNSSEAFESTYLVAGRLMYFQSRKMVENVNVYGDTYQKEPVTVTYTPRGGGEAVTNVTATNSYGDFAVRLPVTKEMGPGTITVSARGKSFNYETDMTTRATDADVRLPSPGGFTEALFKFGPAVVLVGIFVVGGYLLFRPQGGSRATSAKSGRKRQR